MRAHRGSPASGRGSPSPGNEARKVPPANHVPSQKSPSPNKSDAKFSAAHPAVHYIDSGVDPISISNQESGVELAQVDVADCRNPLANIPPPYAQANYNNLYSDRLPVYMTPLYATGHVVDHSCINPNLRRPSVATLPQDHVHHYSAPHVSFYPTEITPFSHDITGEPICASFPPFTDDYASIFDNVDTATLAPTTESPNCVYQPDEENTSFWRPNFLR